MAQRFLSHPETRHLPLASAWLGIFLGAALLMTACGTAGPRPGPSGALSVTASAPVSPPAAVAAPAVSAAIASGSSGVGSWPILTVPVAARTWAPLISRLAAEGFPPEDVSSFFCRPQAAFDPRPMNLKLRELRHLTYGSALTRQIQVALTQLGYTPGGTDGMAGEQTRQAIKAFQTQHRMPSSGEPSEEVLGQLEQDLALPPDKRPAPVKTVVDESYKRRVYSQYLTPPRLAEAENFFSRNRALLAEMTKAYGVPGEVATGIMRVETHFGTFLGGEKAFVILSSMALCRDFAQIEPYLKDPPQDDSVRSWMKDVCLDRGEWAYQEFKALLKYARANGQDPLTIPGSIYGAIGIGQFMPSNILDHGADGDGDGRVDIFNLPDAVFSIGRYLRDFGWQGDMSDPEKQRQVILHYNRSTPYANTVLAVANHLRHKK